MRRRSMRNGTAMPRVPPMRGTRNVLAAASPSEEHGPESPWDVAFSSHARSPNATATVSLLPWRALFSALGRAAAPPRLPCGRYATVQRRSCRPLWRSEVSRCRLCVSSLFCQPNQRTLTMASTRSSLASKVTSRSCTHPTAVSAAADFR